MLMFNQQKFKDILNDVVKKYNSITEFSDISGAGRSYISKYINQKIGSPPTPKILKRIADNSKGVTTYMELMEVCGYLEDTKKLGGK